MRESVEHGQPDRLQHHQLGQQHRRNQRRVAQRIRGDGEAQIARVHVRRTERRDHSVTAASLPDQSSQQYGDDGGHRHTAERGDQVR
jgi:hypothetical protein